MYDIYYINDIFPWAGFSSSYTTSGAISHRDTFRKNEWDNVWKGDKEQLLFAINKLNPIRALESNEPSYFTKETTEIFHNLIMRLKCLNQKNQ